MTQVIRPLTASTSASQRVDMQHDDGGSDSEAAVVAAASANARECDDVFDFDRSPLPKFPDRQMSTPIAAKTAMMSNNPLDAVVGLSHSPKSYPNGAGGGNPSPRYEAFVMTGDKMLRLDSKISPSYAKIKQDQLIPADSAIAEMDNSNKKRGPFDDFPSMQHKVSSGVRRRMVEGVPNSQSEHTLVTQKSEQTNETKRQENGVTSHGGGEEDGDGTAASSVTVNAMCGGAATTDGSVQSSIGTSPHLVNRTVDRTHSEPNSPLKSTPGGRAQQSSPLVITVNGGQTQTTQTEERDGRYGDGRYGDGEDASGGVLSPRDRDAAARLAKRLFTLDGFRRSDVAAQLAKNNEFGARVADEYLQLFNFGGLRLDAALRKFLSHFALTGESQQRERVMVHFARRYHLCNPALFASVDEVDTLTCALLLLNSDLHGQNLRKRMTCHQFIDNLGSTGFRYKRDLLKSLYAAIKETPIQWAHDDADSTSADSSSAALQQRLTLGRGATLTAGGDRGTLGNSDDPDQQIEYKKGWVMRKCLYDTDGKRTPFGRRKWKMFYATLKGMVLYLHKDEKGFKRGQFQTFQNALLVHHALASPAQHYVKRQHVFRVRTANLGEYLFQTSDPEEVQSWVEAVNLVAASFSTAALPAPCSSAHAVFHRPLLPSGRTHLSPEDQLASHERKVVEMVEQLESLKDDAPPLTAKGKTVQRFFYKERYLEEEKLRYSTYVQLLRSKLLSSTLAPRPSVAEVPPTISDESDGRRKQSVSDRLSYKEAIVAGSWATSQDSNDFSLHETDIH